jgi:cytochrome c5
MSKQDSHFFNNFSLVLGILFAVTLGLFAFARHIGEEHQLAQIKSDPRYVSSVDANLRPIASVAVAGQDNSALAIKSSGPEVKVSLPADGTAAYQTGCVACHGAGIAGAPKTGDKSAWGPRLAQGKAVLYKHAIEGFNGKTGVMPAKGGQVAWPDDLVKQAVDHIVELNQ